MTDSPITRRTFIAAAGIASAAASTALAQSVQPPGFSRFPIWPGKAPGGERVTVTPVETPRRPDGAPWEINVTHVVTPSLTMVRPAKPNGAALLIIPGGAYSFIALGHEGYPIAQHFAGLGYTCYILLYRLPGDGWAARPDAPLQDAQRAVRVMRSRAVHDGFDPARIGVLGFSAGGHLAARLSTVQTATYAATDGIDAQPFTLRAAALMYPVILTEGPAAHQVSRTQLFGADPTEAQLKAYAGNAAVSAASPPTFLCHAMDDKGVPVDNSLAMLASLRAAGVPAEAHLFEYGGHGFGLTKPEAEPVPWADVFSRWAARHLLRG